MCFHLTIIMCCHVYSFNIGSAHVVAFSSEFYYYTNYGWEQIANQYRWMEDDLKVGQCESANTCGVAPHNLEIVHGSNRRRRNTLNVVAYYCTFKV